MNGERNSYLFNLGTSLAVGMIISSLIIGWAYKGAKKGDGRSHSAEAAFAARDRDVEVVLPSRARRRGTHRLWRQEKGNDDRSPQGNERERARSSPWSAHGPRGEPGTRDEQRAGR